MTGVPQLNDYGGIFNLVWQNNFEPKCLFDIQVACACVVSIQNWTNNK